MSARMIGSQLGRLTLASTLTALLLSCQLLFPISTEGDSDANADVDVEAASDVISLDAGCTDAAILVDPHNCGVCGHDCLGGECEAGTCLPFEVAANQEDPGPIAVAASGVYWWNAPSGDASAGSIQMVPLVGDETDGGDGGATAIVSPSQTKVVNVLVSDGTNIFFNSRYNNVGVFKVEGAGEPFSYSSDQAYDIAATDAGLLFWSYVAGAKFGLAKSTGAGESTLLTENMTTQGALLQLPLGIDDAFVYFTTPYVDGGQVSTQTIQAIAQSCPVCDGGAPFSPLDAGLSEVFGITTDANYVYWLAARSNLSLLIARRARMDSDASANGSTDLVQSTTGFPVALVVDERNLYWLEKNQSGHATASTLEYMPSDASGGGVLAMIVGSASGLAIGSHAIYWTVQDPNQPSNGSVWGLAKPPSAP